jgi:hypothetical protein
VKQTNSHFGAGGGGWQLHPFQMRNASAHGINYSRWVSRTRWFATNVAGFMASELRTLSRVIRRDSATYSFKLRVKKCSLSVCYFRTPAQAEEYIVEAIWGLWLDALKPLLATNGPRNPVVAAQRYSSGTTRLLQELRELTSCRSKSCCSCQRLDFVVSSDVILPYIVLYCIILY